MMRDISLTINCSQGEGIFHQRDVVVDNKKIDFQRILFDNNLR